MFCNNVFNSLVLDNKLIIFSFYLYYKINALKSLFVEIVLVYRQHISGVMSTTACGMFGASNDKSSSIFSKIVCNLRAPMLSVS